jgi:hypothetical protein
MITCWENAVHEGKRVLAMKCPEAVMLGIAGGAIVQLIALWGSMTT